MNGVRSAKTRILLGTCLAMFLVLSFTAGCAPQEGGGSSASTDGGDTSASSAEFTWTADADCSVCHTKEGESLGSTACLAGFHANENQATCSSCHTDESGLQKVHEGALAGAVEVKRLKKTEVEEATCLSCHDQEALKTVVSEESYPEDINGLKVNPHDMPQTPGHDGEGSCISCHEGHRDTPATETSEQYCFSCHHEDVFECGTCH